MKINLVCVGKIKEKFYCEGVSEYSKRISRFADFNIIECTEYPPRTQNAADIKLSLLREGEKILSHLRGFVILTAIDGTVLSSEGLACLIDKKALEGFSEITFIIGGSNGVCDEIYKRADFKLSFGKMTFPHQLMRVVVAEQIYRSFTILNNFPYHK